MDVWSHAYARMVIPLTALDRAAGTTRYELAFTRPMVGCGHHRCKQNYFEAVFHLGEHRLVGFHGGLN